MNTMTIFKRKFEIEFRCHILFVVISFSLVSCPPPFVYTQFLFILTNCCGWWWQQQLIKWNFCFVLFVCTPCVCVCVCFMMHSNVYTFLIIVLSSQRQLFLFVFVLALCFAQNYNICIYCIYKGNNKRNNRVGGVSDWSFLLSFWCEFQQLIL